MEIGNRYWLHPRLHSVEAGEVGQRSFFSERGPYGKDRSGDPWPSDWYVDISCLYIELKSHTPCEELGFLAFDGM